MKLQVLQDKLSKAVVTASRFTNTHAQLPVLANLHLISQKNRLVVNATNLELSISVSVGAQVSKEGDVTIPARVLSEIVGNLPKKPIDLEVDKEHLKISTENFTSSILGMNSADFPSVPSKIENPTGEFGNEEFEEILSKTLFCVSQDESRPVLTGALFIFKNGELEVVATDGFRLSRKIIKGEKFKKADNIIIPKNILAEVGRLADGSNISFMNKKDESQIVFGLTDSVVSGRIIGGEFPPYEKIIPKDSVFKVNADKEDFLRAVKVAGVFAKDSANVVTVKFAKNGFEILAESKLAGNQNSFVEAKIDGEVESSAFAFNCKYLEDMLGIIDGESVEMSFLGSDAPGVFRDPKDKNFLHLIMPVKIQ